MRLTSSATTIPATSPSRLSAQDRRDVRRWATAAAPFGITRASIRTTDTGDEYLSVGGDDGSTLAIVHWPREGQRCVTLLGGLDLGSFASWAGALAAVRPGLPATA